MKRSWSWGDDAADRGCDGDPGLAAVRRLAGRGETLRGALAGATGRRDGARPKRGWNSAENGMEVARKGMELAQKKCTQVISAMASQQRPWSSPTGSIPPLPDLSLRISQFAAASCRPSTSPRSSAVRPGESPGYSANKDQWPGLVNGESRKIFPAEGVHRKLLMGKGLGRTK